MQVIKYSYYRNIANHHETHSMQEISGLKNSINFHSFKMLPFSGFINVGMVQFKFFLNLVFETLGERVHNFLMEIFPKQVNSDLLGLENVSIFKIKGGIKSPRTSNTYVFKAVGARKLKLLGFSYLYVKIEW